LTDRDKLAVAVVGATVLAAGVYSSRYLAIYSLYQNLFFVSNTDVNHNRMEHLSGEDEFMIVL
jgi:hypothetical protein